MMERTRLKEQGLTSLWHSVIHAAYKLARQQMAVEDYLNGSNPYGGTQMKPKRGAPIGNTNAVKHNSYSSHAKAQQIEAFEKLSTARLPDQIDGLRAFLDRFVRTSGEAPAPHAQTLADLTVYTNASIHLTRLIRQNMFIQSISQPLQNTDDWFTKLMGEDTPPPPPHTNRICFSFVFSKTNPAP